MDEKNRKAGRAPLKVVIVTGMSGAGKSLALRALEDAGFETVDNLPLALLGSFAAGHDHGPVAIGVDVRTRDFDGPGLMMRISALRRDQSLSIDLVFLDSDTEVLQQRYTESRRPHPLADDLPVAVAIETERRLLSSLREQADLVVDTTRLAPADLKRILMGQFGGPGKRPLRIFLTSFGYRHGLPRDADLVFDVRFLKNPHYVPELKAHTGLDRAVGAYIEEDPALAPFLARLTAFLEPLLPLYEAEGKSYLTVAVGCTGGQHRSVYIVERLKAWLTDRSVACEARHRDIHTGPLLAPAAANTPTGSVTASQSTSK
jgi:UPF0042 nucleotide-binding protein